MSDWIVCPNCKGKKLKLNWGAIISLGIFLLAGDSLKNRCETCYGKGFIKPPDNR